MNNTDKSYNLNETDKKFAGTPSAMASVPREFGITLIGGKFYGSMVVLHRKFVLTLCAIIDAIRVLNMMDEVVYT